MDFEVGSLADMISGTSTSKKSKKLKTGTKIHFQKMVTTPQPIVKLEKPSSQKRKADGSLKKPRHVKRIKTEFKSEVKTEDTGTVEDALEDEADQSINQSPEKKTRLKPKDYASKKPASKKQASKDQTPKVFLSEEEVAEQESRTVFVGNLVNTTTKYNLKNLFKKFGEVDAVRLRGAPVANPNTSKRVSIIKSEFHPDRTTFIAYVRFKNTESAHKALAANGTVFKEHTIRVDMSIGANQNNDKKAVFVGNVKFTLEEEDLRKAFETCGKIESVRLVRDKKTGMGKGIAFINFESTSSVELALQLDGVVLEKRAIRVARCGTSKKKPRMKKEKKAKGKMNGADKTNGSESGTPKKKRNADGTKVKKNKQAPTPTEFQGQGIDDLKKKKILKKKKKNKSDLKAKIMLNSLQINPKSRAKKMKLNPSQ